MDGGDRMDAVLCGIDPGLGTSGYAVIRAGGDGTAVVDAGVCRFDPRLPLAERLVAIDHDISAILNEHHPEVVAVEQLYSHYNHPRTAILMGHARGVILLAAARLGIEVRSYSATRIKRYLTGNGRATKAQMQRAIQLTLGLLTIPEPADVADALAIALCCASEMTRSVPRQNGASAGCCHPEQSEGSIPKTEMLRSAQHDMRIPHSQSHIGLDR